MLKRLELIGFKSFADKTQFDFMDGITAIVGPNGSGKSNIVDAVRWTMGEQSAKSLRGGEMADVIFNGSTSRRSLGLAEVSLYFDNRRRVLATEADEVQITRRVYRSGEGEYLINQQPCRLRDIKDLFLGSGAGSDAYSIIQQGQVDVLLQSSNKDRRTIFEEAAGISRFKAKKTETLRKLERVEQNLTRLRDIVDEVDKQLRSVKLQASKAQRYQEYTDRLKELRLAIGLADYHQLTKRLDAESAVLAQLQAELHERTAQADAWENQTRTLEETLAEIDGAVHEQEAMLAEARQRIASEQTTLGHERALSIDLEADLADTRARLREISRHVGTLAASAHSAGQELLGVEELEANQRQSVEGLEAQLDGTRARLAELSDQTQRDQGEHLEQMRAAAKLHNDTVSAKAQVDNLSREKQRLQHKNAQAAQTLAALDQDLDTLGRTEEELQQRLAESRHTFASLQEERAALKQQRDNGQQHVSDLRAELSGLASRIEVLEGLERSFEGLGTGVREVVALLAPTDGDAETRGQGEGEIEQLSPSPTPSLSASGPAGRWGTVVGMVADLVSVTHEYAPLIDLALGDDAQHFVVRDVTALAEAIRQRPEPFSGRVSFLPLERCQVATAFNPYADEEGVIACAADLLACDVPDLASLPAQLLGRTIIVQDLATAWRLAHQNDGYRFLTLSGELLEADGRLTVGAHHGEAGILSRKSELRELKQQTIELTERITCAERDLAEVRQRGENLDVRLVEVQAEVDFRLTEATELRARIGQHRERREGLHEEVALSQSELNSVESEIASLAFIWRETQTRAEEADRRVAELKEGLERAEQEVRTRERERHEQQQEVTQAKVALGKIDERLSGLRERQRGLDADLQRRRAEQQETDQRLSSSRQRLVESQATMLRASADLAQWYLDKEAAERRVAGLAVERDQRRRERQVLADKAQAARNEWREQQEQSHARELEVNDLKHRRKTLVERLAEDYQIDLAEIYRVRMEQKLQEIPQEADADDETEPIESAPSDDVVSVEVDAEEASQDAPEVEEADADEEGTEEAETPNDPAALLQTLDPEQVNEEIGELRRKLARLGSVNLDALEELNELETRSHSLKTQNEDLASAQRSLQEIIDTINRDSKRLFTETFNTVRTHFQELFRKVFGGGMADIVLEDENDILECGIDIIARPPGKELRSLSLLSGGEKTMAAVALLLAIFRSKPSPFCILDEVDAALDEANIGRYTSVLREFLDRSQFIIVTHSKKTMACADVLYGVTMQESGISKRVAVRFEDWPDEDGDKPQGANNVISIGVTGR